MQPYILCTSSDDITLQMYHSFIIKTVLIKLVHIGKFDIFPLISVSDIIAMNELTLILEIIAQCDVKHVMTLPLKKGTILKLS